MPLSKQCFELVLHFRQRCHVGNLHNNEVQRIPRVAAYRAEHAAMFAGRIGWSRRVAQLLSRPALLDAALLLGRTPAAGELLVRRTRADRDAVARLTQRWFSC